MYSKTIFFDSNFPSPCFDVPKALNFTSGRLQNRKTKNRRLGTIVTSFQDFEQPRSQGLSSLPPLVVGRKTLVAAGHVTTQNLGGKKVSWIEGVAEYFVC